MALIYLGLEYEVKHISLLKVRSLSPTGKVPWIRMGKSTLNESDSIIAFHEKVFSTAHTNARLFMVWGPIRIVIFCCHQASQISPTHCIGKDAVLLGPDMLRRLQIGFHVDPQQSMPLQILNPSKCPPMASLPASCQALIFAAKACNYAFLFAYLVCFWQTSAGSSLSIEYCQSSTLQASYFGC